MKREILCIGMVANFIPWKQHFVFLELVDRVSKKIKGRQVEAYLVGGELPGQEEYYQKVSHWIDGYNGPAAIHLLGFQENVAEWFHKFDVVIHTAEAEPFGLVFLEAMYEKCVVVGSIKGSGPEIIKDGVTGCLVDFSDLELAARKIVELVSDKKKCNKIGEDAKREVLSRFSIENQIKKIENIFK